MRTALLLMGPAAELGSERLRMENRVEIEHSQRPGRDWDKQGKRGEGWAFGRGKNPKE